MWYKLRKFPFWPSWVSATAFISSLAIHSFVSATKILFLFSLFKLCFVAQVKSVNHKQKKASVLFIDNPKIYTRKG